MKNKLTDRPILLSLLAIGASMPLIWLFLTPIVRLISPWLRPMVLYSGTLLVTAAFCQECYGKIPFSTDSRGFLRGLFTAGAPGLLLAAGSFAVCWQKPQAFPGWGPVLGFLGTCVLIALSEAFLFRGLILTALKAKYSLWKAIMLCSLLFGLRQLLGPAADSGTAVLPLVQAVSAFFTGVYLCAVYQVTGSLWVCAALHFLDSFCIGFWGLFSPLSGGSLPGILLFTAVHAIYLPAGWRLLKGQKKI